MSTSNVTENKTDKLFRRDGRSFKFHLEGLNHVENAELSKLIIENGGEICETSGPPAITFTNRKTHMANDVVFHVNYIHECLKHRKLLDLINFKYGDTGFYGCLMSIFISGKRSCPYTENHDPCYSSIQIVPKEELFPVNHNDRTQNEHNYVNANCVEEQDTKINSAEERPCRTEHVPEVPPIIWDEPPEDSEFEPQGSLQDSDFLPDKSPSTTYFDTYFDTYVDGPDTYIDGPDTYIDGPDTEEWLAGISAESEEVQNSESTSPEHAASSKCGTRKMKRKIRRNKKIVDDQATVNRSKDTDSPVILRDQFNQTKVLGGINESLFRVQKFDHTSSDSDDTFYIPSTPIIDQECRKSPLQDASIRLGERDDKGNVSRDSRAIPGPSRSRDVSEGEEKMEVIDDYVKNDTSCSWIQKSGRRSLNPVNLNMVSSTRSSDDVVSIDNNDSDSLSEDDRPNSSSRRAAVPGTLPESLGLLNRLKANSKKRKDRPVSRNFLPWEQREMVKYLIDNECISEAKGNRVWQQMIEDGELRIKDRGVPSTPNLPVSKQSFPPVDPSGHSSVSNGSSEYEKIQKTQRMTSV